MRLVVTGTPGTGKTTATDHLDTQLDVIHLNDVMRNGGHYTEIDRERDSVVADLDSLTAAVADSDDVVIESHLAHHCDADRVVVLRCRPDELEQRLILRGTEPAKAEENARAEALDIILTEAVQHHGEDRVYEIDTTDLTPKETADRIESVITGDRRPSAGTVSFMDYLDST